MPGDGDLALVMRSSRGDQRLQRTLQICLAGVTMRCRGRNCKVCTEVDRDTKVLSCNCEKDYIVLKNCPQRPKDVRICVLTWVEQE
jgi:hypothetical protein